MITEKLRVVTFILPDPSTNQPWNDVPLVPFLSQALLVIVSHHI